MEAAVYIVTGFLESGKTRFMQEMLADDGFSEGERTLLLVCEEGEEEYDADFCRRTNCVVQVVEDLSELTTENLRKWDDQYKPDRVIMEYNGMWQLADFFRALPENWMVYQEIFAADSETILNYNANMRSLVVDKLQSCDLVVFNRITDDTDKMPLHKLVRGISRRANIEYDYTDGRAEADDIEDPLPFDLNADVIDIADNDYALWYQDLMEDMLKYDTKTVRFKGIVAIDGQFPPNTMAVGRHIMTCCADDIQFGGLICKWKRSTSLKARDWVVITAKVSVEYNKLYGQEGPVLVATRVEFTTRPDPEVVTVS